MKTLPRLNRSAVATRFVEAGDAFALLEYCLEKPLVHREDWENAPEEVRTQIKNEVDAERVLRRLVRASLLTEYQAERIEAGTTHGLILGSYRVLDRIGAGGMGVVFRAEHIHLRRPAAIKMLPLYAGAKAEGPLLERFFKEIRIIAQLQHPNIVWALDTGEIAGEGPDAPALYYHVMEYVPGNDLERVVETEGPLTVTRACDLTYQIASALAEAEKQQLVHRDIKPSNIIVTPEGQAKLLDFGLARSMDNRHTQPGVVLGSIDYLAPEQARDASTVDIRADIYSLGGTLFWALTGRVPFPSNAPIHQQIFARLMQPPPSVTQARKDLPADLDAIMARMMATKPDDRYATPQTVMRALLPFLRSESGESVYLSGRDGGIAPNAMRPEVTAHMPTKNRRLLIVDDDSMMRGIARHVLAAEGFECAEAGDGKEALGMVRAKPFDLLLIDVEMPHLRGDALLRQLRDQPPWPNLKVVMASGRATVEEMSTMLIAGADDFIGKPFSIVQLIARVKAALRLKDAQDRSDTLAHTLLKLNQQLEQNLRARDSDLIDARNALTLAIAELVAHRGVESGAHLLRIQQYVRALAQEALGSAYFASQIDANYVQMLEATAPLHDLGMIGLPEYIFLKPGKLTDEERLIMRSHTTMGADILQKVARSHGFAAAFLQMAIDITRHHHERWDGKGYPDRLHDEAIPLSARFVAIADVYDALRARRPHKPALSHASTVEVMTESSQGQFDPNLVHVFRSCGSALDRIFKDHPD